MNIYRSNSSFNANIRSSPPRNNKNVKNRVRDHSLTPKKSKNQKKNLKREEADLDLDLDLVTPAVTEVKEASATAPEKPVTELKMNLGPDPKDLPKDVISRGFSSSMNKSSSDIVVSVNVDKFSGSVVFTPSPPPSSLPLPTFSLRPKLSCKSEAVSGVDAGATDNLRRLLRL
ncbi:hypothetical protein QVD17_32239 [Tagetes erecta]|uniref:Uncharacterized protein n=1 Tax=Tagetes erecta TaxID=13708 RepID=A0AAD8NQ17_TARER|nr:hypothetical protein QVD17_32239 [Tagetes erecta]